MEKKNMLQVLVPAAAAAAVVVLIGALIAMSDWNTPAKDKPKPAAGAATKGASVDQADMNDSGMSATIPDVNVADWKPQSNGMKTWDVVEGTGEPCPSGATVNIHYTGWTTNGLQFDSSRGKAPANFPLGNLIQGWQIGIPGMKPGGIRRLSIPGELGYGPGGGAGGKIGPNATLIFEVKLLGYN